ncbi:hypothetical protein SAMD00019534_102980 [Acytostelium subglobosum LB1]|uniref:hypothetical protein n=1 Tax=Acytostelium subglobosum LB1 TaxID=1410327 RepID=UPI000644AF72|nr:hypothetical protein SAMD00019534_102980 [Acytostelium subglobosum LB1]GAM27123.1 hypothetical protein SAMD00019534_102980 [Acytostelium subglobosum LB1]|eukprot:XP_012750003.1 hypothetical protein SAMD00019534_102980 [Acytostelium subglobosum LB1]
MCVANNYINFANSNHPQMFLLSLSFCFCFLIRTVIFLYNPITHKFMNEEVFLTIGYFIPDIIPTLLQMYIWHSRMKSEEDGKQYINTLYENELDDSDVMPKAAFLPNESSPLVIQYEYY